MKIRQGFVSNSSTSSFVVLAVQFPKGTITDKDLAKAYDMEPDSDAFYDLMYNGGFIFSPRREGAAVDDKEFIGVSVASNSDCGLDSRCEDLEVAKKKLKELLAKLPELPAECQKLKIISGQYCS